MNNAYQEGECGEIIFYQDGNDGVRVAVRLEQENVWMDQAQMAALYQTDRTNVGRHIHNIYQDQELQEELTSRSIVHEREEGGRIVSREIKLYNLDVIISLGYRVKSSIATHFRRWATERLKEYVIKGFTMDDERLKQAGGGTYWKELLDRIRDIRSSEKVFYRQVLDLFATSVDYDPKTEESRLFFRMVQNKLHYATHQHTAAELIYNRADAERAFMGLSSFKGDYPTLADTQIAKNYLSADELRLLNNLVSGYFDFAEIQAMNRRHVYMKDYISQLDAILTATGQPLLEGAGSISHAQAMKKAEDEYRKFQIRTLSPVEQAYLSTIRNLEKTAQAKLREKPETNS